MAPNAGETTLKLPPAGSLHRTKLNGLVASTLKSKLNRSLIRNVRPAVSASCLPQNPRTQLSDGARFPKLNPVVVVNAAELRYLFFAGSKSRGFVTLYGETLATAFPRCV